MVFRRSKLIERDFLDDNETKIYLTEQDLRSIALNNIHLQTFAEISVYLPFTEISKLKIREELFECMITFNAK